MINVMLDLETFGTSSNALIVSIGAVKFDENLVYEESFFRLIQFDQSSKIFDIDPSTILWWLKQSDEAKAHLNAAEKTGLKTVLKDALKDFNDYVTGCAGVYGNGATFDNVILRNAYTKLGIIPAWSYKIDKCYRTLCSLFPGEKFERVGVYHNPVDDARTQAEHLIKLNKLHGFLL